MKDLNDITIPYCDLDDAVENIIYDRYSEYDATINRDLIKLVIKQHLMSAIEDILSDPAEHFKGDRTFWNDLENSAYIEDVA